MNWFIRLSVFLAFIPSLLSLSGCKQEDEPDPYYELFAGQYELAYEYERRYHNGEYYSSGGLVTENSRKALILDVNGKATLFWKDSLVAIDSCYTYGISSDLPIASMFWYLPMLQEYTLNFESGIIRGSGYYADPGEFTNKYETWLKTE